MRVRSRPMAWRDGERSADNLWARSLPVRRIASEPCKQMPNADVRLADAVGILAHAEFWTVPVTRVRYRPAAAHSGQAVRCSVAYALSRSSASL
jgi:hypothetical protein